MWIILSVTLIASVCGTQLGELESCDSAQLKACAKKVPPTRIGLPRTREELDAHCSAYNTGMSCMDAWIKRCLPTDAQKILQQQVGGARAIMRFLCSNESALRKEYLKESTCWSRVSPDWSHCVDELTFAVREIEDRAQQLTYFNRNDELCCARDEYLMCVAEAGRVCTMAANNLLKRIAFVISQDVASCSQQPKTYCSASPLRATAPFLVAVYNVLSYFPRF